MATTVYLAVPAENPEVWEQKTIDAINAVSRRDIGVELLYPTADDAEAANRAHTEVPLRMVAVTFAVTEDATRV